MSQNSQFINLRAYTTASMDFGLFDIEAAVEQSKQNPKEYPSTFAITERNNMFSVIDFYKHATAINPSFKPIVGIDLTFCHEHERKIELVERGQKRISTQIESTKYPLLLLAKNEQGYQNLCKLQTLFQRSNKADRITEKQVQEHKELLNDIIVLSGGNNGYLFDTFLKWQNSSSDEHKQQLFSNIEQHLQFWKEHATQYYIELQRDGTEYENDFIKFIAPLAIKYKIPVVATNNTYFNKREDYETHELFMAHKSSEKYSVYGGLSRKRAVDAKPENYLKSTSKMKKLFADIPIAIENTQVIAEQCNVKFELYKQNYLPELQSPNPNENMDQYFTRLSYEGLDNLILSLYKKYGTKEKMDRGNYPDTPYFKKFDEWHQLDIDTTFITDSDLLSALKQTQIYKEYQERLDYEIGIIIKMKFPSYFLVVADFIQWSKNNHIPVGAGRGSGAGSLVAHVLTITDLDPLQFDLLFERFLNPERVSMPDFDIDFSSEFRGRVIEYVRNRYNKNNEICVTPIMNVGRYDIKSSIDMAAKSLNINQQHSLVKSIKELVGASDDVAIDEFSDIVDSEENDEELSGGFFDQLKDSKDFQFNYHNNLLFRKIINTASKYYKNMRNVGKHAAGIVISSHPIDDHVPLINVKNEYLTQFNKDNAEAMGLIKFDFLGLENLTIIDHTLAEINKRHQNNMTLADLSHINLYDDAVYENIFQNGNAWNVFQFSSGPMINYMKKAKPTKFEDLIALVALYRPGPMDLLPDFIARMKGAEFEYMHPLLEPILKSTYGIMVYQEQVMQAAQVIGGYSLGGADLLRRAMGKKKPEEMAKHRAIFAEGAAKKGISVEKANEIFDYMEKFAGYGFNKSHAAAYAFVAYQTAWLKHYYPEEYLNASLQSNLRTNKKSFIVEKSIHDAIENGVNVKPIDINESEDNFALNKEGEIVVPFKQIKGFSSDVAVKITSIREQMKNELSGTIGFDENKVFSDANHFLTSMIDNHCEVSDKVFVSLIRAGAFSNIEKGRERYLEINAKTITKYVKGNHVVVKNELFKTLPSALIKSSAKQKSNKNLELVEVKRNNTIEEELQNEHKLIGFILDENKLNKLYQIQKYSMKFFRDNDISLLSTISTMQELKDDVAKQLERAKQIYIANNNYEKSLSTYGIQSRKIISGYITDEIEDKYGKKSYKVVTDDGIVDITSYDKDVNAINIKAFEHHLFIVKAGINSNFNPLESNEIQYTFNLIDLFPITNIYNQLVKTAQINFSKNEAYQGLSSEEQYAKLIEEMKGSEIYIENLEEAPSQPISVSVGNNQLWLPINEISIRFLHKNKLTVDVEFQENALENGKINENELNGNAKKVVKFELMNQKLKDNEQINKILPYTSLSTAAILTDIHAKNYTHLMYGYIKEVKYYKGEISSLTFIDQNGQEIERIKPVDNLTQPQLKLNEPCLIKLNMNRSKTGNNFCKIEDIYYDKNIKTCGLWQNVVVIDKDYKSELLEHFSDEVVINNASGESDKLNNDKYIIVKYRSKNNAQEYIEYHYDVFNRNEELVSTLDTEYHSAPLFNCNQEEIKPENLPKAYQKNSLSDTAQILFDQMDENLKLNFMYVHKGAKKFSDCFTKAGYIQEYELELASKNETVAMLGIISEYEEKEGKNDIFFKIVDETGHVAIRIDKTKEGKAFDFKYHADNKIPLVFKMTISPNKKINGIVYKNIIDVYTIENVLQSLSQKIYIRTQVETMEEMNDIYKKLQGIAAKYQFEHKKAKPIQLELINHKLGWKNDEKDHPNPVTKYSDVMFNEIKETLDIKDENICVALNPKINQINPHHLFVNYQSAIQGNRKTNQYAQKM